MAPHMPRRETNSNGLRARKALAPVPLTRKDVLRRQVQVYLGTIRFVAATLCDAASAEGEKCTEEVLQ